MSLRDRALPIGVALVVLLAMAWVGRSLLHGLVMVLYVYPAVLEAALVLLVGLFLAARLGGGDREGYAEFLRTLNGNPSPREIAVAAPPRAGRAALVLAVAVVLAVLIGVLGGAYAQEHVGHSVAIQETDQLPEIDASRPRVLPQSVAEQYAANSLQFPRYELAPGDVAIIEGKPYWTFGLAPDGAINNLLLSGKGAVVVNMTTQRKDVSVVEANPKVSFGVGLASDGEGVVSEYRWRLLKGKYLVAYEDPIVLPTNGGVDMAVPYVTYEHHVRFTPIPVVYTTPTWGGVAVVNEDGTIRHLSPEAAREAPELADQRLYPFDLARYYVQSQRYVNGIVNKWFVHEGELEVAPLPGSGNDQPFLTMTADRGMQYVVAVEPYGNAQGIYQVYLFDGRTGAIERYRLSAESALMGPRKAADYVRKANDRTDWDRFQPAEPLPAVIDGTLYWQVRVVPQDASGIAYTAFVAADSGDVYTFDTDQRIRSFLAGRGGATPPPSGGGEDVAYVIKIRAPNGTVINTVTVTRGQTIQIETPQNGTTGNGTAQTTTVGRPATTTAAG
ncbi:MAG: ABC transporter permease [Halanaeroarchaeum sp.]